ncbi:MAG: MBL fold metallo-hydrolase [Steroidobacteraceae bacterium]
MKLTFLGGAGTVTGSKYLVRSATRELLVDCGLFQGLKRLRERNWQRLPFDARTLGAILLTHAHIDHSGYLPVLAHSGFGGPVYCTAATAKLLELMLPDSARLQQEDARFANRHRFSKHSPALPLYTEADAMAALKLLRPVEWLADIELLPGITGRFSPAGHLLGAASVLLETAEGRLLFSGDLGRPDDPIMLPPARPPAADWLLIESTYGDRLHPTLDPQTELATILNRALAREAVVVIPAFAVGRAQSLLHLIANLKSRREIPEVPVFLNSPMATDVTAIYSEFSDQHRLNVSQCRAMCSAAKFVNTVEESKHLNTLRGPMIIVSASGMATGGRVLHHLKAFAPDPRNLILFSGYQAAGTRGAAMVSGAEAIKMHGEWIPVRAEVAQLHGASSHADRNQLLAWLRGSPGMPGRVFVTHGEPVAADTLRQYLRREFRTEVSVPEQAEQVELRPLDTAPVPGTAPVAKALG